MLKIVVALLLVSSCSSLPARKLRLKRSTAAECGEPKNNALRTPNFPSNYPADTHCMYTIPMRPDKMLNLKFVDFDIENSFNCSYDYVEIRDHQESYGRYCGRMLHGNNIMLDDAPYVKIIFHSDKSLTKTGFNMKYSYLDKDSPNFEKKGREVSAQSIPTEAPVPTQPSTQLATEMTTQKLTQPPTQLPTDAGHQVTGEYGTESYGTEGPTDDGHHGTGEYGTESYGTEGPTDDGHHGTGEYGTDSYGTEGPTDDGHHGTGEYGTDSYGTEGPTDDGHHGTGEYGTDSYGTEGPTDDGHHGTGEYGTDSYGTEGPTTGESTEEYGTETPTVTEYHDLGETGGPLDGGSNLHKQSLKALVRSLRIAKLTNKINELIVEVEELKFALKRIKQAEIMESIARKGENKGARKREYGGFDSSYDLLDLFNLNRRRKREVKTDYGSELEREIDRLEKERKKLQKKMKA